MSTPSPPRPSTASLATLVTSALVMSGLAVYQWIELLVLRAGGKPTCAINDTVNCATVWDSAFASRVHDVTGMPVVGFGLTWGLAATVLSVALTLRALKGRDLAAPSAAVKLWGLAGALTTVTLATASVKAGAVCLTCLGTYALVLTFAAAAFVMRPAPGFPASNALIPGVGWSATAGALAFLALLYPSSRTPKGEDGSLTHGHEELVEYLNNLPENEARMTSKARAEFLRSEAIDGSPWPTRLRLGPSDAPVRLVEFSDVLCTHCAQFEKIMEELREVAPKGRLSVEPRYYPLVKDHCAGPLRAADAVRCLGAKAQVCLESSPKFWDVRKELFEQQTTLTPDRVLEIALKSGMPRDDLIACLKSPETQQKIEGDVAFAEKYEIEGTPLVVLNGRKTMVVPTFLLGMALSGGDVDAPYFKKLPTAP